MRATTQSERTLGFGLPAAANALHFYGAGAIVLCGWAFSRLLQFDCKPYAPLWFAGALLVYNIDRLKHDPSDAVNTPIRCATAKRLRRFSAAVITVAALVLVGLPLLRRDWLLLALTVSGSLVCANYSLSPLGFRLKDIPLLKTFLAPTIVLVSFLAPPLLHQGFETPLPYLAAASGWLWMFLCFNMILCDLRDIAGDILSGTRSVPVVLGRRRTLLALQFLLWATLGLGVAIGIAAPSALMARTWAIMGISAAFYQGMLLKHVHDQTPTEAFFEWWVEGMLFIPPLIISLPISKL